MFRDSWRHLLGREQWAAQECQHEGGEEDEQEGAVRELDGV
jgi:hypothetical protein